MGKGVVNWERKRRMNMSLRLITGGSGAGKTELLYKTVIRQSMEEPDGRFFVIVPEQATMQAQREIVRLHPRHGTMNIDILSFKRLAYRIFSELSMPQPEVLDDMGKTMVLRKLAGERRKELVMFSSHLGQAGFLDEVKSMISELYQYAVTPDMLREQMEKDEVGNVLSRKLQDVEILYRTFQQFIKDRYITVEEILDQLCAVVPRSALLKDSVIALDGYTGFTPVQYRLISLLLDTCRNMYVAVTAPETEDLHGPGRESDLFDMSRKMTCKLTALAEKHGVEIKPDLVLSKRPMIRFEKAPALDFLERMVYRYPYRGYGKAADEIRLVQAQNPADEVDFVVNRIHQLVRERGFKYREIALVCGDLEGYSREITHQFEENGIPVFIDETKNVMGNPLIRLIKSSMEILQRGFDYESMFQYLRTGLISGETEKIDRMENYVRALGIRGFGRWDKIWDRVYEGAERLNLDEMNRFREDVMIPLRTWKEAAGGADVSVGERTKALVELLKYLEVERQLKDRSTGFTERGMYQPAREYGQIYGLVMELFDRLYHLLGDEKVTVRDYREILEAGLAQIQVGMIPACVDRVVAGDLKRTRLDQIRVLFFVGVNEGIVPADTDKGGILTEQEREVLKRHALELAPTAREEGFMQRFYLYLTVTKPREQLYVSWSTLSSDGKTLRPSSLVGQIKKRFPQNEVFDAVTLKNGMISIQAARKTVIQGLQDMESIPKDPEFEQIYGWLSAFGGREEEMEQLAKACTYSYQERGIGREAAKELYGQILNGSVTRMENYAACAYAHFLTYGLELKKRREYELDLSDMGNLFHRSIDLFFRDIKEQGKDFRNIGESERKSMVKACVKQVSEEYRNTIMKSSARNSYLERKVERIADRTIRALIYQIQKGDFEPEAFEVDVSTSIPLSEGEALNLRGRIDRLDTCEEEDRVYVKIMDYKSGSTSFDLALLYHGLQLQLVVYMDAAMDMEKRRHPEKETVPAGIFYYHIDDPMLDRQEGMTQEEIEAGILKKLRMNGLVNSSLEVIRHMDREIQTESDVIPVALKDGLVQESKSSVAGGKRFEHLSGFVKGQLKSMGDEILNGKTAVNPYKQGSRTACDYCPFHSVCGFDLKTTGYGFRRFKSMRAEEIWKEIEPEEEITKVPEAESTDVETGRVKPGMEEEQQEGGHKDG